MKLTSRDVGNLLGWASIFAAAGIAGIVAYLLGFVGLILLGMATAMVCSRAEADEHNPSIWARADLNPQSRADQVYGPRRPSPEDSIADRLARSVRIAPLRFYFWCGIVIAAAGVFGFLWQQLVR